MSYTTDAHFFNSPVKIGSIYFFSSSDMQKFHHFLGCHTTAINSSVIFVKCFAFFRLNILDKKAVLIRLKIKLICLREKAFSNSYKDSCLFIINSNNQELIHHIHCFGCIFYHQSNTEKSC